MSAFDSIIAYEDVKEELLRYADVIKDYGKYEALGVSFPRGVMIFGEPGLGKTMLAKCFIQECGCTSYTIRKDKPDGEFINYIKENFDKAKHEDKAIILLDDIDKFANEDYKHSDAEEYVTVQACIDECAGSKVFVIMTVNDKFYLPDSLKRSGRICSMIELRNPEKEQRKEIIRYFLGSKNVADDVDEDDILRLLGEGSCADLEEIINEAGVLAVYAGSNEIKRNDILLACIRKKFSSPKFQRNVNPVNLKRIAVHEAGHALVAEVLEPGSVNYVSIYASSEEGGGVTCIDWSKTDKWTMEYARKKIMCILGGKAATEMVYGVADVGCRADMEDACSIIRMLSNSCAFGFEAYDYEYAEFARELLQRSYTDELNQLYQKTKKIIAENRSLFDKLVEAIFSYVTLTYREIEEIKISAVRHSKQ